MLEVTLGGAVAVIVWLLIVPVRADRLAREAAARVLGEMAKNLPEILASLFIDSDRAALQVMQDRIGRSVSALQDIVEEIERERPITLTSVLDPAPLPRTLLRLRHDFVMMGRASAEPLPAYLSEDLKPNLDHIGESVSKYFRACALALTSRNMPPPLVEPLRAELDARTSQLFAVRQRDACVSWPT